MSRRRILSREIENIQSFHKYSQRNNFIDILNDDCLEHVFKFLPIMDRLRLGKGECSILRTLFFTHFSR